MVLGNNNSENGEMETTGVERTEAEARGEKGKLLDWGLEA